MHLEIIENSTASPKRKEVTAKLLESGLMDNFKIGVKGLGDVKALRRMYKEAGWTEEQMDGAMPSMIATMRDAYNKAMILGAAEVAKQDSKAGKTAKDFLEKLEKIAPAYLKTIIDSSPSTATSKAIVQNRGEIPVEEQKLRENIRLRIVKIIGAKK